MSKISFEDYSLSAGVLGSVGCYLKPDKIELETAFDGEIAGQPVEHAAAEFKSEGRRMTYRRKARAKFFEGGVCAVKTLVIDRRGERKLEKGPSAFVGWRQGIQRIVVQPVDPLPVVHFRDGGGGCPA